MLKARITGFLSLALLMVVLAITNLYVLGPLRQTIIDRELGQIRYFLGNHAKLLGGLLRSTELMLENALLRIDRDGIDGKEVHGVLRQAVEAWPMARVIGITDATGWIIHSSRSVDAPRVDLSGRDYVAHWLLGGAGTQFISGPVRNAVDEKWQISLSVPIRRDGRLAGVVAAVIDIDYLAPILQVSEETSDYATLLDREFRLIARFPERPNDVGRSLADAPVYRPLHDPEVERTSGTFINHFTGEERIAAALRFYDDNLILSSSRPLSAVLGYWRPLALINAMVSALLAVAAALAVLSTLRHMAARNREALSLVILNRRLEERTREAERLAAAKSDFLAVMSHEIRTPLTAVMGMIDLAARAADPSAIARHLGVARQASATLLAIINDILDMSRLESGRMALESIPFDVAQLVEQVMATVRSQAEDKGLALSMTVAEGTPRFLRGDPTRLTQILLNLLGNAVKFTERGQVTVAVTAVGASADRHRLRFEVADTGPGIPAEQQGDLFKPFEQLAPSRVRKFGGSGLGLSISKAMVDAMGGGIGVESVPGIGSRFWFEVELAESDVAPEDVAGENAAVPAARPLSVLVVDDNAVNRELISEMLASHGHRVSTASSGRECLALGESGTFDVVLLDIQMPEMDGIATIRELRRLGLADRVAIIAVTANALSNQVEEYRAEGFDGHVAKPIEWAELLRVMTDLAAAKLPASSLDEARIRALTEVLGPARVRAMVDETLRELRRAIAELDRGGAPEDVESTLHTLRGMSGNFGLSAVVDATGVDPARQRDCGPRATDALRQAVDDVERDLRRLWGADWRQPALDRITR